MEMSYLVEMLNSNYDLDIKNIELFREGGNLAYVVYGEDKKFFLKIIRPPFIENTLYSIDIQLFLMKNQFPVIPIGLAKNNAAYVETNINDERKIFILYEFIEGEEPNPENTEEVGELIGKLHSIIGGLGEAVCSVLSENYPVPVKRIGVNDVFGHSGPAAALLKQFGLCAENIEKTAREMLNKKLQLLNMN
jgi:hypothetical protein